MQVAPPAIVNAKELFTIRNEVGLYWPFTPKAYFAAIHARGSPVNIRRDLDFAVPPAREQADMVLVRVESIFVTSRVHIGSVRPRAASAAALVPAGAACAVIPTGAATAGFEVFAPPGGAE